MPLSELHVLNVCKVGQDGECKYLLMDELEDGVFNCAKLSPQRQLIDDMMRKDKSSLHGSLSVKDYDNCSGYPVLRYKKVGYDQKNS